MFVLSFVARKLLYVRQFSIQIGAPVWLVGLQCFPYIFSNVKLDVGCVLLINRFACFSTALVRFSSLRFVFCIIL